MDLDTITVTWMDDRVATYENVSVSVRDGVLHLTQYTPLSFQLAGKWHHPTANIRTWEPSEQPAARQPVIRPAA